MPTITIPSPVGPLTIEQEGDAIVAMHWGRAPKEAPTPLLQEAARQLGEYFAGARRDFDLPLRPEGSPLEQ
ncbi:MAG TPA: cysteine methyltransferase, partial [Stellaceae bacterium]|nr:cysteine methyltransferase [Stellaceae bacterium]